MTYSEYFEKNNISFSESMNLFNKSKFDSFDVFLKSEYKPFKFNVGDIIVLQLNEKTRSQGWKHNVVFKVKSYNEHVSTYTGVRDGYILTTLTQTDSTPIGSLLLLFREYAEENCELY